MSRAPECRQNLSAPMGSGARGSAVYLGRVRRPFEQDRGMIRFPASAACLELHCPDDVSDDNADNSRASQISAI